MRRPPRINGLLLALFVCACFPGKGDGEDTADDGEAGTGEGESGVSSGAASTTCAGCEDSATEDGTDGDAWGDESGMATTGGPAHTCELACAVIDACDPESVSCLEECTEAWHDFAPHPECIDGLDQLLECIGGLSCDEYIAYLEEKTSAYPCAAEERAFGETCDGGAPECLGGGFGGDGSGTSCWVEAECESGFYEVSCTADAGCVCRVDGIATGTCDDFAGVCDETQSDLDAVNACCGWDVDLD